MPKTGEQIRKAALARLKEMRAEMDEILEKLGADDVDKAKPKRRADDDEDEPLPRRKKDVPPRRRREDDDEDDE